MILFRWRCWLRAIWYLVRNPPALRGPFAGATISGHEYAAEVPDDVDVVDPDIGWFRAEVSILKCVDCGSTSVGWRRPTVTAGR